MKYFKLSLLLLGLWMAIEATAQSIEVTPLNIYAEKTTQTSVVESYTEVRNLLNQEQQIYFSLKSVSSFPQEWTMDIQTPDSLYVNAITLTQGSFFMDTIIDAYDKFLLFIYPNSVPGNATLTFTFRGEADIDSILVDFNVKVTGPGGFNALPQLNDLKHMPCAISSYKPLKMLNTHVDELKIFNVQGKPLSVVHEQEVVFLLGYHQNGKPFCMSKIWLVK